jgi:hypothetical protein
MENSMKLTFGQIKQITKGAVRFSEDEKGVHLYRFTEKQEQLFKERNLDFYKKTFATAGVKFVFRTDSETLHIGAEMTAASSRKYFSFDVFADGKLVGYLDNFSEAKLEEDYSQMVFPDGEFSKTFDLGKGIKTVTVYLPDGYSFKSQEGFDAVEENGEIVRLTVVPSENGKKEFYIKFKDKA